MSIHIADNNSAPLGMSGHLRAYLYLFSHCSNNDGYPKGTRDGVYGTAILYLLPKLHLSSLTS